MVEGHLTAHPIQIEGNAVWQLGALQATFSEDSSNDDVSEHPRGLFSDYHLSGGVNPPPGRALGRDCILLT